MKGKFWPTVRAMIWEKAQELYQFDQASGMKEDFTGITAERNELVEHGYFYTAKIIVLRELYLSQKADRTLQTKEGERAVQTQDIPQNS